MTKEDKQLLLKDLCGGLPYHLGIRIYNDGWEGCRRGEFDNIMGFHHVEAFLCDRIEILPYLRPMSTMTEEEFEEYYSMLEAVDKSGLTYQKLITKIIDWLDRKMIDHFVIQLVGEERDGKKDWGDGEQFYQEVLRRFNEQRKK